MVLWFVIFLTSCGTSGIIVKESTKPLAHRLPQPSSIFIFTKEKPNLNDSLLIGTIINPCHRIRGSIYSVPNPEAFEKEILWNPDRKLKVSDFKGSTNDKPFVAATNAYFGYNTRIKPKENIVIVEVDTYFNCELSYFKNNKNQSLVLNHEQLHFDITELYARKFTQRLQLEVKSFKDLVKNVERIGNEVHKELQLKQDAYDTDVYSDLSQQSSWDEWTKMGLKELDIYRNKIISRPYRLD